MYNVIVFVDLEQYHLLFISQYECLTTEKVYTILT